MTLVCQNLIETMKRIIITTSRCPGTGLTTFGNNAVDYLGGENVYLLDFSKYLRNRPESSTVRTAFDSYSSKGEKVPDDIIVPHIEKSLVRFLADKKEAIVFIVGVPRTIRQAVALVTGLRRSGLEISIEHLFFHLEAGQCEERMLIRKRKGETPEIIKKRICEFGADMAPVIESLREVCDRQFEFLADELLEDYPAALQLLGLVDNDLKVLPLVA